MMSVVVSPILEFSAVSAPRLSELLLGYLIGVVAPLLIVRLSCRHGASFNRPAAVQTPDAFPRLSGWTVVSLPACFFRRFFLLLLLPFPRAPTATLAVRLELSLSPAVRLGPSLSLFSAFVAPDPILPFIFARYAAAAPRLLNARVPAVVCDLSFLPPRVLVRCEA